MSITKINININENENERQNQNPRGGKKKIQEEGREGGGD
jgi:hypothetical protein